MQASAPSFLPAPRPARSRVTGIARLAAQGEPAEQRNQVDYTWINCRSVLNRVQGTRVQFEWSINPYRGCEIGCPYCYARYPHEFMNHHDPMDFERKIYMKRQSADRLRTELASGMCKEGETIVIGAATDPYQPAEKRHGMTRSILEVLAGHSGYRIEIITKSDLILRDRDLLKRLARRHRFQVNVTITTTSPALARKTEPRAVTPRRRFEAVRRLNEAGISAGVFLAPVMPGINDDEENLEAIAEQAARAGAAFLAHSVLFLTRSTRKRFDVFLADQFASLMPLYRRYYGDSVDAPAHYRRIVKQQVNAIAKRHGLRGPADLETGPPAVAGPMQPVLF